MTDGGENGMLGEGDYMWIGRSGGDGGWKGKGKGGGRCVQRVTGSEQGERLRKVIGMGVPGGGRGL